MTAGTSLTRSGAWSPCSPFTVRSGGCYHFTVRSGRQHRAPARQLTAPSTSTQHRYTQRPAPAPHPRCQLTAPALVSLPRALPAPSSGTVSHHARSQLTAPVHHSPHQHPVHSQLTAPAPATCLESARRQLIDPNKKSSPPGAQPAPSARHQRPVSTTCTASSQHQHRRPATCAYLQF